MPGASTFSTPAAKRRSIILHVESTSGPPALTVEQSARRRIARRLLPFLWLLYVIAFLDRVNVAYAALEMSHDLRFSDRVFGTGAGIFFIGYVLLEIPGAIIVERWSARRWIARIMISWGVITVLVGLVHTSRQFYAARFLLGMAEAGFFPGIIVYLTHWFRWEDRAKAVAVFMTAIPLSNILGSPLAGQILKIHWHGLQGWRWLFILEGVPAVVFGVVTFFYLTDWPRQAVWLTKDESDWITGELEREKLRKTAVRSYTIWQALANRDVLLLTLIYFMGSTAIYGFIIWFPTILKRASGLSTTTVTFLVVIPYLAGLTAMVLNAWDSDRTHERRWHTAGALFLGGASLVLALAFAPHIWIQLVFFILFAAFVHAYQPTFWALPTALLGESAAAASIGLINCIGGLGGFVGPFIMGYLVKPNGSFVFGLAWLLVNLFLGGILVLYVRRNQVIGT
jgi:MFS transporter, ACS family, tartrate transporter